VDEVTASRIRLVAFDVDGTLLRGATICEAIAEPLGRLEAMRVFERPASREHARLGREEMARWYAGVPRARLLSHLVGVVLAPGAEDGFRLLREAGVRTALVSITWRFAVAWLAERLGADAHIATDLGDDGEIDHFWPEDKATWLQEHAAGLGLSLGEVAAVGDSDGDLPMLRVARRAYFVGRVPPADMQGLEHLALRPKANIADLAREILTS
jgi:HAD superfamily phosphoserine phosphatase-like hydrolase